MDNLGLVNATENGPGFALLLPCGSQNHPNFIVDETEKV